MGVAMLVSILDRNFPFFVAHGDYHHRGDASDEHDVCDD